MRLLKRSGADDVLFHHRYPTSTENTRTSCHPFSTKDYFEGNYVFVHNGVINNAFELKKKHEKLGIKYFSTQPDGSFNDSEALMWEVALTIEGRQDEVEAKGSIAFIMVYRDKNGKQKRLYWGRNYSNPLWFGLTNKLIYLSSETPKDSTATEVEVDTLHWYNYSNGSFGSKPFSLYKIPKVTYEPNTYNYSDYSDRETYKYTDASSRYYEALDTAMWDEKTALEILQDEEDEVLEELALIDVDDSNGTLGGYQREDRLYLEYELQDIRKAIQMCRKTLKIAREYEQPV